SKEACCSLADIHVNSLESRVVGPGAQNVFEDLSGKLDLYIDREARVADNVAVNIELRGTYSVPERRHECRGKVLRVGRENFNCLRCYLGAYPGNDCFNKCRPSAGRSCVAQCFDETQDNL